MNKIYNQRKKATFQFTDSKQSHLITTDDARVGELGLSSFTTGILYDWMFLSNNGFVRKNLADIQRQYGRLEDPSAYLKKELSNYRNLSVFDHKFIPAFGVDTRELRWPTEVFLQSSRDRVDENCQRIPLENYLFFYGWRNKGRNGEYKLFNQISIKGDWTFTDAKGEEYTWDDLKISQFKDDENFPLFNYVVSEDNRRIIQQIIQMNDEVNQKKGETLTSKKDRARRALIYDIRSSKFGCLQWTSTLRFLLADPQTLKTAGIAITGCNRCAKTVSVDFKLFLYDEEFNIRESQNTLVPNHTRVALPKRTITGRPYSDRDERGMDSLSIQNTPANATAAEIKTNFVELEGKFESGTSQVYAVMTTDLEASKHPPIELIEEGDETDLLDPDQGFSAPTGKAIVIEMQNGNPKQWMPNFEKDRRDRKCSEQSSDEDIDKKEEVTVVNITQRAYSRGDSVILQKLGGVWVPLFAGPGGDSTTRVENIDPKWQFMYLMTNSRFFFRDRAGDKITPAAYESSFYNAYYEDDLLNYLQHGYATTGSADVDNGYFQCTSWDFMGVNIGGTRRKNHSEGYSYPQHVSIDEEYVENLDNGNALSNTQALYNTKNEQFAGDDVQFNSYPFFGCVFPDGYSAQKQYGELTNSDKDFYLNTKNYKSFGTRIIGVPFHYPTTGNPFANNNDVVNILNSEPQNFAQAGGMFDGETGQLKHLPADIGTNASPSGKYGQPVSNIALIGELNKHIDNRQHFRDSIGTYFASGTNKQPERYSWMHKHDKSRIGKAVGQDDRYGYLDSAFDLQPADYLTIQFRPLSAEVYACMEGWEWTHEEFSIPPTITANFKPQVDSSTRGKLAKEASGFTKRGRSGDYAPPISSHAVARNKHIVIEPNSVNNFHNLYNVAANNTSPYADKNANGLRYKPDLIIAGEDSLAENQDYPISWWDDNWAGGGVGNVDNSLGGIGIIGAVVSVATLDTLQLNTQNRIGIDDQFEGSTLFGSSWGATWENVKVGAQNTIGLHAKVYQKWPREYTIYDPRFFVVHHFNKDIEIQDKNIEQEYYLNGELLDSRPDEDEQVYPSGNYSVDKKESDLDIRIPTYYDNRTVSPNTPVYSDSQIRKKSDWRIDKQRRGKLLPYKYEFRTIGIGGETQTLAEGQSVGNCDIVIINGGEGYSDNDTFTVSKGSAGGVVLKPVVDTTIDTTDGTVVQNVLFNTIVGFTVESAGAGFSKEDFLSASGVSYIPWEDGKPQPALGSLRIQDGSNQSGGTGLEAYVVRGTVVEATATDIKPPQVLRGDKNEILLSAQKGGDSTGQELQVEANINQVFKIDPELKQENHEYDVFLHFHNDITQNRVTDPGFAPRQAEQHITLQILNNNGASTSVQVDEESQPVNITLTNPDFNSDGQAAFVFQQTLSGRGDGPTDIPRGGATGAGGFFV